MGFVRSRDAIVRVSRTSCATSQPNTPTGITIMPTSWQYLRETRRGKSDATSDRAIRGVHILDLALQTSSSLQAQRTSLRPMIPAPLHIQET